MKQPTFSVYLRLAPALMVISVLIGASAIYAVGQSLGYLTSIGENEISLVAYKNLLSGEGVAGREFLPSLGFSLWVSVTATFLSACGALLVAAWLNRRPSPWYTIALNWNLAFPHLVWAVGTLLLLGQSGLIARWATMIGIISTPAQFPVLVRDRYGIGIIIAYIGKEIPFLTLVLLSVLRSQTNEYLQVAENLGANRWQRFIKVTIPLVRPALVSGMLLVFAYIFGAYEVPALLGVRYPRALPILALETFSNPDLHARAEGMAISLIIAFIVLITAGLARAKSGKN